MFASNPFAHLTSVLPASALQAYVVLMALAVVLGTLADLLHKGSARYFAQRRRRTREAAIRRLDASDLAALAARTLAVEVAAAGEFCRRDRRLSHLLTAYGFVFHLAATVALVFAYPAEARPPMLWPLLWHLGALMVLAGGGWFFFFLRVDVAHEGHSPFRLVRADLFVVALLASAAFALAWSALEAAAPAAGWIAFGLYILASTLLFVTVPWSKFAHMFYKPVVAYQRRVEEASGASDLPAPAGGVRCPPSHT